MIYGAHLRNGFTEKKPRVNQLAIQRVSRAVREETEPTVTVVFCRSAYVRLSPYAGVDDSFALKGDGVDHPTSTFARLSHVPGGKRVKSIKTHLDQPSLITKLSLSHSILDPHRDPLYTGSRRQRIDVTRFIAFFANLEEMELILNDFETREFANVEIHHHYELYLPSFFALKNLKSVTVRLTTFGTWEEHQADHFLLKPIPGLLEALTGMLTAQGKQVRSNTKRFIDRDDDALAEWSITCDEQKP